MTLFDSACIVGAELEDFADPETGEIDEARLIASRIFERKAQHCVEFAFVRARELEAKKQMLAAIQDGVRKEEARLDRFKDYLSVCMKAAGVERISANLVEARLYIGRDEVVEIDEGADFPPALCGKPKPPAPSKTLIKAAIKDGEPVAGARLVRKDRLTIK